MTINLTQKERMLLQDQISHEKICIEKYNNYANQTQDPQLKQLLQTYARQEEQHLNTLNQILSGKMPNVQQQQQGQQQQLQGQQQQGQQQQGQQQQQQMQQQQYAGVQGMTQAAGTQAGMTGGQRDHSLCNDLLMTEKYVSNTYDTAIFEFTNSNIRQILNHIQKEEQQHGEGIFNYMQSRGMYNPQ
ncbi:MAG: spore coat protein [bacterium]|jgi:spore coat protein CotF|nr:spore coat protein [Bacillota bacterium]